MLLVEWAREIGIHPEALRKRLARGWALEEALALPPGQPKADPVTGQFCKRRAA